METLTVNLVFYSVALFIGVLGFIGNTLAFIGFNKEHQPTSTIFLLKALAIIDNLVLATICPFTWLLAFAAYESLFSTLTIGMVHADHYVRPLLDAFILSSAFTTVVLAINRVIVVCFPSRQWSLKAAKWVLAVSVGIAFLYNLAFYFLFATKEVFLHTMTVEKYVGVSRYYVLVGRPVVFCILPVATLLISTVILLIKLRQLRRNDGTQTRLEDHNNKVTWMLVMLLIVFIVCSLPWPLLQLLRLFGLSIYSDIHTYLLIFIYFGHIVNSSVNFLIYAGFSRFYRNRMLSSSTCFRRICPTGNEVENGSGQSQTGNWTESPPDVEKVTTI